MLRLFFRKNLPRLYPHPTNALPPKSTISSRGFSSKAASLPPSSAPLLTTFRGYDIPEEETNAIVAKFPMLLTLKVDKNLRPKLDFLRGAGFTGADLAQILLANPSLLAKSLERSISSSVDFLKTILPSKEALIRVLKSTNALLTRKQEANINLLKDRGVTDPLIVKLLHVQPRALARSQEEFAAAVGHVEDLGLSPTSGTYVLALGVMSYMSRSTFLRKMEVYKELGWSEGEVLEVFRKQPACMKLSDENVRRKMEFFRERVGWGTELLSMNPVFLLMSLEKRIIPRCAVLNVLMSRGLVRKHMRSPSKFLATKRVFFERYVKKYEEEVPEVVRAYQGKIEFQGWEWLKDSKKKTKKPKALKSS